MQLGSRPDPQAHLGDDAHLPLCVNVVLELGGLPEDGLHAVEVDDPDPLQLRPEGAEAEAVQAVPPRAQPTGYRGEPAAGVGPHRVVVSPEELIQVRPADAGLYRHDSCLAI